MKKIITFLFLSAQLSYAQDISLISNQATYGDPSTQSFWGLGAAEFGTLGIIFMVVYFAFIFSLIILNYVISSYSLALLDKHYNNKKTSKQSWIPFYRYYIILFSATKQKIKSFYLVFWPIILFAASLLLVGVWFLVRYNTGNELALKVIGISIVSLYALAVILSMIFHVMIAFILKKYVKGDTTTALGFTISRTLVLWYVALDRVRGNTNIIGKLWFAAVIIIALGYIIFFAASLISSLNLQ